MAIELSQSSSTAQPFVLCTRGQRWLFPIELLEPLGVVSGQQVSDMILTQLLHQHVAYLASLVALDNAARH